MFTLHSIGCLNAVLSKLYACEVKKIFLQFFYPSFYWLRWVCPGCHVGHACGHSSVLSCSRVRVLRGIAKWRVVALWSFLFVLSEGVRFGFEASKRGGWLGEGSPALWGIWRCKVEVNKDFSLPPLSVWGCGCFGGRGLYG